MAVYNRARNPIPSRGTGVPASTFAAMRSQGWSPGRGQIPSMPAPMAPTAPMVAPGPMPARPATPLVPSTSAIPQGMQNALQGAQFLQPFMPQGQAGMGQAQPEQEQGWGDWLRNMLIGTPGRQDRFIPFSPTQQAAFEFLLNNAIGQFGNLDQSFDPIEQRARQQYQQQTVPSLAERFTGLGGGQRSSAFAQTLGQSGSDLESQLAALRSQYNLQRSGQLQSLLGLGLAPRYESIYQAGTPGFVPSLLGGLGSGLFGR